MLSFGGECHFASIAAALVAFLHFWVKVRQISSDCLNSSNDGNDSETDNIAQGLTSNFLCIHIQSTVFSNQVLLDLSQHYLLAV